MSFAVDLELVDELVAELARFEEHVVEVVADIERRVARVHAVWTGVAADESRSAHGRWAAGAAQLHEALGVLRTVAATARTNYAAAVRANVALWSR